ncbi:MAG: hypothetical protein H6513_07015 [Acidimicrobiaceae bacterium]|nr:hypothetical protein [Acidimicrobiaceae bacterium]MCO5330854.1 hypothetical protein [Ilumatobacteraceae bacterium]
MSPTPFTLPTPFTPLPAPGRLKPIDIRRAVLSVFFLHDGGPLTIPEVVQLTHRLAGLDLAALPGVPPHRRVSDILRHQVRAGRAEVVERGRYRLHVGRFSTSTRWRCLHWQRVVEWRARTLRPPLP